MSSIINLNQKKTENEIEKLLEDIKTLEDKMENDMREYFAILTVKNSFESQKEIIANNAKDVKKLDSMKNDLKAKQYFMKRYA